MADSKHGADAPARVERWELDLVAKVASAFRTNDPGELEAELARKLLVLKTRSSVGIRNWKAYLAKFLYNKASNWVRDTRARRRREPSLYPPEVARRETISFEPSLGSSGATHDLHLAMSRVPNLTAELKRTWEVLREENWNQSAAARRLGKHRNTIRRHLQAIRRTLLHCPIENVSGGDRARAPRRSRRTGLDVTWEQRRRLSALAQAPSRKAFRAHVILALASLQSYKQIATTLATTAPTIARWKRRFEAGGIEGLKARHRGRQPTSDARSRVAAWLRAVHPRLSCRKLAHTLGISKSTTHRILRDLRTSQQA